MNNFQYETYWLVFLLPYNYRPGTSCQFMTLAQFWLFLFMRVLGQIRFTSIIHSMVPKVGNLLFPVAQLCIQKRKMEIMNINNIVDGCWNLIILLVEIHYTFMVCTLCLHTLYSKCKARVIILRKNRSFWPYLYYNFFVSKFHWKYIKYKDIGAPGYIECDFGPDFSLILQIPILCYSLKIDLMYHKKTF